ncbi:MAG: response regulator [Nitrospirae bacterium]|nr:response regulator [Nitrospirota bacterium]MBF0533712.1 response regulator [Nitrospirota bacterium]MBF0615579.1 response regulator [Nitrospirota bacterium]
MMPIILIADDEQHIRMLIEQTLETLEDEGVEILTAENGAEALEIIKEKRPELVFLDVMMPKMNGFDVCNTVKNVLCITGVYIIMLTAKGQEFDKEKGVESGCNEYVTKPFSPRELKNKAKEILGLT